ncbi:hypothetical protein [Streptomyces sp. NPDC002779]|uniref:hypothetical protein n=1 Tax=Streptomyces sp. NPDC002779 TaxID=3364664 RepID=UPI0036AEF5E3
MSTVRSLRPGRTWLRTFVLLLALCVPAAPAGLPLAPVAAATEIIEYDLVAPAPRPGTARRAHRAAALPPRPAPHPRPAALLPPPHPYTPPARRSVVLRC